jgi:hypothetical protein
LIGSMSGERDDCRSFWQYKSHRNGCTTVDPTNGFKGAATGELPDMVRAHGKLTV